MIEYYQYTAKDVRDWLYEGACNGLREEIISKVRADALLHNPYVEEDTILVFAAKNGDEIVGYTAQFPEYFVKPDMWFMLPTTLYVKPQYEGEFIGYALNEQLHRVKNGRCVMGIDMAPAAAMIDKLLGMQRVSVNRSRWILKRDIKVHSWRSLGSWLLEPLRLWKQWMAIKRIASHIQPNIRIEYATFVDAETYRFIQKHSGSDSFLHSQEMLNWIMHYPFVTEPILNTVRDICEFGELSGIYRRYLSKVYQEDKLVGVFMLTQHTDDVSISMLYVDERYKTEVYQTICRSIIQLSPSVIRSLYDDLDAYITASQIYLKHYVDHVLMTCDKSFNIEKVQLQGIDGDMFV